MDAAMRRTRGSSDALWLWFSAFSLIFLAVLAISPVKDYFREYRSYQKTYRSLLLQSAGSLKDVRQARSRQTKIRQFWIPDLHSVDRCITCHLGVEEPKMVQAPQPFRLHPRTPHTPDDLQRFGCVVCHQGQGRATSLAEAHGSTPDWNSPLLPVRYTEATCGRCHLGDTVPEASMLSAGRSLMKRVGCYGCHKVRGHEDWQSTAPDLNGLAQKTTPSWLHAWLESPRDLLPNTWMPNFHLSGGEIDSLVAFLWVQPPTPAQDLGSIRDLPPGDADRGKVLFSQSRCISCHTVEGRGNGSAPELSTIGSKVNRRWLVAYIGNPSLYQPNTPMPQYDFTHQDLLDLSQYLMDEFTDPSTPPTAPPLRPAQKAVLAGENLYEKYGCAGCHHIVGREDVVQMGPDLTGIGEKSVAFLDFGERQDVPRRLSDWLAAKVSHPRSFREGLRMPEFGFTSEQVQTLVTALLAMPKQPVPEKYRVPVETPHDSPPGHFGELVSKYRCLSCHQIAGMGGDISTAPLGAEGSKVRQDWLEHYLLQPYALRPILTERMIPLRMPGKDAAFLTNFIENVYRDDRIPDEIFPDGTLPDQVERGDKLFHERYGCQACHMVHGKGGYYGPLLDEVGRRLKSGWIYWWLRGPQRWRADVREPDYGLDENDARDLAAYLVSLSPPKTMGAISSPWSLSSKSGGSPSRKEAP